MILQLLLHWFNLLPVVPLTINVWNVLNRFFQNPHGILKLIIDHSIFIHYLQHQQPAGKPFLTEKEKAHWKQDPVISTITCANLAKRNMKQKPLNLNPTLLGGYPYLLYSLWIVYVIQVLITERSSYRSWISFKESFPLRPWQS